MDGWLSGVLTAAALAAVGLLVVWLNNGKQLMTRVNVLTEQLFAVQDRELQCQKDQHELKVALNDLRSEYTAYKLQMENNRLREQTGGGGAKNTGG